MPIGGELLCSPSHHLLFCFCPNRVLTLPRTTGNCGEQRPFRCGYCGYALNLSSSARNTAGIGSKYGKQIRKGVVSFVAVDESRFTLTDEVTCTPYFRSGLSWGFFRRRSRLLCRKCGGRIGNAYEEEEGGRDASSGMSDADGFSDDMRASSGSGGSSSASSHMNYLIKISALQPSSDDSDAL